METTRKSKYSDEIKAKAKELYLASLTPTEIAKKLGINSSRTVYSWINKGNWNSLMSEFSLEMQLENRVLELTKREKKTKTELDEIDRIVDNLVKIRKASCELEERFQSLKEREANLHNHSSSSGTAKSSGKKKKPRRNDVSDLTEDDFQEWIDSLYKYQKIQFNARKHKERWTLKSRQIGLTYEAAGEALFKMVVDGKTQVFLSASRAQAEVFRSYMVHIAKEFLDLELTGNPIRLSNGATAHFLGTNLNTAQSYSGDVYIDEAFWINKFDKMYEVASAMATLADRTITVFSTPSTKQHKAYSLWTGKWWKGKDPKRTSIEFPTEDLEYKVLRKTPQVCPDKRWRFVITIDDAIAGGNNKIDKEDLQERYSSDAFAYLFLCQFMDEADSIFRLADIEKCPMFMGEWEDFNHQSMRPLGDKPVWIGYDPSRINDQARCYVIAPPDDEYKYFRVIEEHEWKGFNWQWQSDQIENLTHKYNVQHIGVDCSGIGSGVAEQVQAFFPRAMLINYTYQSKQDLVLKALDVVHQGRLRWRDDFKNIGVSFMAIKRKTTGHGNMTFVAERSEETGHADSFFAICHALIKEGLNVARRGKTTLRLGL